MQGLIDHGTAGYQFLKSNVTNDISETYKIYFGLGQRLSLAHTPEVFKVSAAGVRLGHHLVQSSDSETLNGKFLDVGTGSGVHALLMRKLGANDITAADISEKSIEQARINEHINFSCDNISFLVSDLFDSLAEQKFKTIVFNPPGWRTPSPSFLKQLETTDGSAQLPLQAMFYGDEVIARFLDQLPRYLDPTGRAIVGLNSLVGISDVLHRYNKKHHNGPPLRYKLVERHTFPLIYYSTHWRQLHDCLKSEFDNWEKQDLAACSTDQNGNIYWSYEIIEFSHCTHR